MTAWTGSEIQWNGSPKLRRDPDRPFCLVGSGTASCKMKRGSFRFRDKLIEKIPLYLAEDGLLKDTAGRAFFSLRVTCGENRITFHFEPAAEDAKRFNRLWFSLPGKRGEHIYGGGEQFTKLDLKGELARIWVREHQSLPSIAKKTLRENLLRSKPDFVEPYHRQQSYYVQPTILSSELYFLHVHGGAHMEFDFRSEEESIFYIHELADFTIGFGKDFEALMENLTQLLGRQPRLPEWAYDGAILGIQGGTRAVEDKLALVEKHGMRVAGVWSQDWQGRRITPVGKQLMWNWHWDSGLYPELDKKIHEMKARGLRFLGYINPFLAIEKELYAYASPRGYCVKDKNGRDYLTRSTTFSSAMVDFTNPEAYAWIKGVIQENMIDFGLSGWMADFGEYLPTDCVLHSGEDPAALHNLWPAIWAGINREAIQERGKLGEIFFFTRAGYTGTGAQSTLMWNGDQYCDWSFDGGMPSVIPAMLSLSCCGFGLSHSDTGGFSVFLHVKRSPELMVRWAEMNAFSPVFRSHEGIRPESNAQFDHPGVIEAYAKLSRIHANLKPYLMAADELNHTRGIPVVRPLFFYYNEKEAWAEQYEYLLGRDILVAPVLTEAAASREGYLPKDEWLHLWTGEAYSGGRHIVPAPLGQPPVFCRKESGFLPGFMKLREA
ncbi:MAG: alpha-glucosidase [Oscillospiraceae bacterium]|nr:alpha-glucosidase [Oscillospiraceae bacterium]